MKKESKAPLVLLILNMIFVPVIVLFAAKIFVSVMTGVSLSYSLSFGMGLIVVLLSAMDLAFLMPFSILAYTKEGGWTVALIVWSAVFLPFHILALVAGILIRRAENERKELAKDHPIPMSRDLGLEPLPEDEGWADDVAYFRPVHDEDLFKYFGRAQALPAVTKVFERKRVFVSLYLDNESKQESTFECMFVTEYGNRVGERTYVMYYMIKNGKRDYDSILHFARLGRSEDGKTFLQVVSDFELIKRLDEDIATLYGEQIEREKERLEEEAARRQQNRREMLSDLGDVFGTLFMSDSGVRSAVNAYRGTPNYRYSCTFTNSMGCQETVYTDDKVRFYRANGEYVGYSEDGGRTIIEE